MKSFISTFLFCTIAGLAMGQFAPPAGQPGSTAIHTDSSIFVGWATGCTLQRGFRDISDPSQGYVTYGDSNQATGFADALSVTSLGDGGSATLTFETPIINGPDWDFAVFENAFVDTFLELAYVEVSSDGNNFHRFPATSNTQDSVQVESFGGLDATKINNLAGKYLARYGTPFDLEELKNINGLDVNNITHVRVIDVVGCIQDSFARYDKNNNKINDPWRTDFLTGGFDLDAVGVINTWPTAVSSFDKKELDVKVYPNPSRDRKLNIQFQSIKSEIAIIEIFDWQGRALYQSFAPTSVGNNKKSIGLPNLATGNYLLRLSVGSASISKKLILQ